MPVKSILELKEVLEVLKKQFKYNPVKMLKKAFRKRTNYEDLYRKYPRDRMKLAWWWDAVHNKKQKTLSKFVELKQKHLLNKKIL